MPWHVLNNQSLSDIVDKLPENEEEMMQIHGMGAKKTEQYAGQLLDIIRRYMNQNGIKTRHTTPFITNKSKRNKPESNLDQVNSKTTSSSSDFDDLYGIETSETASCVRKRSRNSSSRSRNSRGTPPLQPSNNEAGATFDDFDDFDDDALEQMMMTSQY